jgi:tetratricopeptide (TPR) repeat protein
VAELLRVELEQLPETGRASRRELGQRIDAAAEEALAILDRMPESAETQRIRADLLATMIRSDFRAKRYEAALKAAVARALELDPDSPRALVAAAKPLVFAPPGKGRDLAQALRLLDRALVLAPGLEPAQLLRAEALDRAGRRDEALTAWRAALAANPACRPARHRLEQQEPAGR